MFFFFFLSKSDQNLDTLYNNLLNNFNEKSPLFNNNNSKSPKNNENTFFPNFLNPDDFFVDVVKNRVESPKKSSLKKNHSNKVKIYRNGMSIN